MALNKGSIRLAYDASDNLEYFATNTIDGIDETLPTWEVFKLVMDGDNLSYMEGPITGAWDNKTLLDWT